MSERYGIIIEIKTIINIQHESIEIWRYIGRFGRAYARRC